MLTLRQVFNGVMLLLGYDDPDFSTPVDRSAAFDSIQAALQTMQSAGEDYYGRDPLTLTLHAGTSLYALDSSVQTVLEGGRLTNGQVLRKLTSRGQYMQFGPLFMGTTTPANSAPLAYWSETLHNSATSDSVKVNIYFAPPPDQTYSAILDVIRTAPLYTASDLCGNSPVIPVPHQYAESIFMPLVRWNLLTHPKWYKNELNQAIETQYERALLLLGLADPRRPKPPESNTDILTMARQNARTAARDAYNQTIQGGGGN